MVKKKRIWTGRPLKISILVFDDLDALNTINKNIEEAGFGQSFLFVHVFRGSSDIKIF